MTKRKSTKRALLLSALSLLMCVSMLIGSTFAWFTDSVTSTGNKIQAGNLDLDLYLWTAEGHSKEITNESAPIFGAGSIAQNNNAATLWEPGKTQVAYLSIKNNGSLDLKYKVAVDVRDADGEQDLYKVMQYAIINDAKYADVTAWDAAKGVGVVPGVNATQANDVALKAGEEHFFALSIHMPEEAGNEYMNGQVNFDLRILATQLTSEFDSFNNQYDKDAKYPLGASATVTTEVDAGFKFEATIPAEAPAYNYGLKVVIDEFTNDKSNATLKLDMSLVDRDDNNKEIHAPSLEYSVKIQLPHPFVNMDNFQIFHGEESVSGAMYDKATQTISFTTTGFSPFTLKYIDYADPNFEVKWDEPDNQYAITKGIFFVNPVNYFVKNQDILDKTATIHSDCIAVDFVKDNVTYYVVSDRETSVFVSADASVKEYVGENETFDELNVTFKSGQSGKLYSLLSGLQNNEHNTIYLLPGTYKEGTTIGVYSSMDIIGLGDTDTVKIEKQSSSSSNRHLFNCSGTKEDYIQVTLHNLYLDATAKTTNNKDNAAVQSIRKTKVKCYDLTVVKGTDWDAVAFYVNGSNAVNNVKYPAYMYVENCCLNTTRSYGVVTTSGSYKFFHTGLTYGGNAYTNNSGSNKNIYMAANDWIWD